MISKKAASEIVVRQALAELDQWDVQARFILNPHKDSRGKDILLVKDFKEVLNKVNNIYVFASCYKYFHIINKKHKPFETIKLRINAKKIQYTIYRLEIIKAYYNP